VLDYLLHVGSENTVLYLRDNLYIIRTLKEFQYIDEDGKDCGANVRQKAKDIFNLISDPTRLLEERQNSASMRDRMFRGHNNGNGEDNEKDGIKISPRRSRDVNREEEAISKDHMREASLHCFACHSSSHLSQGSSRGTYDKYVKFPPTLRHLTHYSPGHSASGCSRRTGPKRGELPSTYHPSLILLDILEKQATSEVVLLNFLPFVI